MKAPPHTAEEWRARAALLRREQRMVEAEAAMACARTLAPGDPEIVFLHAQMRYELGLPAAEHFATALRLAPDNRDAMRNHALALASEGRGREAMARLDYALDLHPDWLDGQRVLAALRWTSGDTAGFDAGFAKAARANPACQGLWLGWFGAHAQHRDWPRATAILDEAERHLSPSLALLSARVFVAGESGDLVHCEALLAAAEGREDAFLKLARIRLHLRRSRPQAALEVALPLTATPIAGQVWPYVSTCWRLLGDARAAWLDGDPPYAGEYDVGLTHAELSELAVLLRRLHTAQAPYAEQSVRGGTQTDRSVLLRHEPILQRTRAALMAAVREHVAGLPPFDPAHPLLSRPRENLAIGGSWSVRLGPGGHNVTHSHPLGWLSSAFYVALPEVGETGGFHLGAPPSELGLDLAPYRIVAPKEGHLVLFPSTLWHGTYPIAAGERLNIAFDIVPAS